MIGIMIEMPLDEFLQYCVAYVGRVVLRATVLLQDKTIFSIHSIYNIVSGSATIF